MSNERDSIIDAVFDSATNWAVYGLGASQRGLEATARWLEARAKVIGELATKLATPSEAAATGEASGPQKA
jgi:hypothetical protein